MRFIMRLNNINRITLRITLLFSPECTRPFKQKGRSKGGDCTLVCSCCTTAAQICGNRDAISRGTGRRKGVPVSLLCSLQRVLVERLPSRSYIIIIIIIYLPFEQTLHY